MIDPQANYLINTAPELQERFVNVLKNMAAFSQLSDVQLLQLFRYSKFVELADQDRPIKQGDYDQTVYILIRGRLEVFMTLASGEEERLDVIFKPFSLVGTQCILGEPRIVSIEAKGEALLIGIDISLLPDIIDGFENLTNRANDSEYVINRDIFTVFASALVERLNRRIKDQYKLGQRARNLKNSKEFQNLRGHNLLSTTLFNQFCRNELSTNLELQHILDPYKKKGKRLHDLIHGSPPVNTAMVYIELIRANSLGKLDDLNQVLFRIVEDLTQKAKNLAEYSETLRFQFDELPALLSFSSFLDQTYESIKRAKLTAKRLTKSAFLKGFLAETYPNPPALLKYLEDGGWVNDQFSLAYIMFLICQNCILTDLAVNQRIGQYIKEINLMGAPRQNIQYDQLRNFDQDQALSEEVVKIYQSQSDLVASNGTQPSPDSGEKSVDDLLAEFDM